VEIEPAVVQAAAGLRPFNARALDDPRSRIHYEDAKSYFAARQARYDVIVSEPSNPWVSGVASLFSIEFYRDVRRYLRDGGLLVQWINTYETTPALIATVIAALDANFTDYELWMPNGGDLLVVAAHRGQVPAPDARAFGQPKLRETLARFGIRNLDDLLLHRIAGRAALRPYFRAFRVPANSDFHPILDQNAARARFLHRPSDEEMPRLVDAGLPLLELFDRPRVARPDPARLTPAHRPWLPRAALATQAGRVGAYLESGRAAELEGLPPAAATDLLVLRMALVDCSVRLPPSVLQRGLLDAAWLVNQHLPRAGRKAVWRTLASGRCQDRLGPQDRLWLRLHAALGAGDAAGMAEAGGAILAANTPLPQDLFAYALAAHMAGLALQERGDAAMQAIVSHGPRIGSAPSWQAVFRFLVGQIRGG
jgi:hypothetical protein